LRVAHVERGDMYRRKWGEFFLQGLQTFNAPSGQRQRPASGGKTAGGGAAEAGCRAGNEDGFVHFGSS